MPAKLFVSYRRSQFEQVHRAVESLRKAGMEVFFDMDDIDPLADFPQRIRDGIAASHVMLVWWSKDYADSDICLQELRTAWQHARKLSSDVVRRVWILNPEDSGGHVCSGELGSSNYLKPPATGDEETWAANLTKRAEALLPEGPFADERGALPAGGIYNAPHPSLQFTGRGVELWRLHSLLHPARVGGALRGVAVQTHGLGGIGKTELAAKYCEQFAAAYPGGVFWLNLAGYAPEQPSLATAESAWLEALRTTFAAHPWLADAPPKLRLTDTEGKALPAAQVRAQLERLVGEDVSLWVLDNVPVLRPDDLREAILNAWSAPSGQGRTLVTTRDSRALVGFGDVPLEVLGEADALRLLIRFRSFASAEIETVKALIEEVGAHTLALTLLGHRVHRAPEGYQGLLVELHEQGRLERIEQIAGRLKKILGGKARGILATVKISIDPLDEPARRLLALASLCAPNEPIPTRLLADAYALLPGAPADPTDRDDQVWEGLNTLTDVSLLASRRGRAEDACPVEIHPLVADASLSLLEMPEKSTRTTLVQVFRLFGRRAKSSMSKETVRTALTQKLLALLADNVSDTRHHAAIADHMHHARHLFAQGKDEAAISLGLRIGQFDHVAGRYVDARAIEEVALLRSRTSLFWGKYHPLTLASMNNLADTLRAQGELAGARRLQEQMVDFRRRVLGKKHPDTLRSMNNLALTLQAQGDLAGARRLQEEVLALQRRVLGKKHPDTLRSMSNLAATLHVQGDFPGAHRLQEQALDVYHHVLGENHRTPSPP